jgi:hypothetical protein
MKRGLTWGFALFLIVSVLGCTNDEEGGTADDAADDSGDDAVDDDSGDGDIVAIDVATLTDKVRGAWVGQMAGVAWGAPTEFNYHGRIIPDSAVPEWSPDKVDGGYLQDDLYVEIPFLEAFADYGPTVGWEELGTRFRDTKFPLWHGNKAARDALRDGVAAPGSGHYSHNEHADDLDWQIEADFVGTLAPGLPAQAAEMAWRAGHVIGYGDGVYGGVFVAAMHAAAFFATSVREIAEAGVGSVPEGSTFRAAMEDVIAAKDAGLAWEDAWQVLQDRWASSDRCPDYTRWPTEAFNIDAKLNSGYVLIGLLWGNGDFSESMRIAMRCGQDSDCNPSTVGSILGNWRGLSGIPPEFTSGLTAGRKFLTTTRTLDDVVAMSVGLAQRVVLLSGGTADGTLPGDVWTFEASAPAAPILEQWPANANDPPTLWAAVTVGEDGTATFTADADDLDGILGFEWSFGDLTRAFGANVTHVYPGPGTYTAVVHVADGTGNTSWREVGVVVP